MRPQTPARQTPTTHKPPHPPAPAAPNAHTPPQATTPPSTTHNETSPATIHKTHQTPQTLQIHEQPPCQTHTRPPQPVITITFATYHPRHSNPPHRRLTGNEDLAPASVVLRLRAEVGRRRRSGLHLAGGLWFQRSARIGGEQRQRPAPGPSPGPAAARGGGEVPRSQPSPRPRTEPATLS